MRSEFKEHIRNIIGKLVEQSDLERDNKVCFLSITVRLILMKKI